MWRCPDQPRDETPEGETLRCPALFVGLSERHNGRTPLAVQVSGWLGKELSRRERATDLLLWRTLLGVEKTAVRDVDLDITPGDRASLTGQRHGHTFEADVIGV